MTDLILTQQTLENRRILLSVELPKDRLDEAMRTVARRLSRDYHFPGFRPGKAPYHIVVQRIGRENLLREVAASIGQDILREALDATGIEPHGPIDLHNLSLEPFALEFEIPLAPKIELGDYRSIRIEPPAFDEAAVEAHIQEHLQEMLKDHKTWQVVERPAEYGDRLVVDFQLEVDGEVVLSRSESTRLNSSH
jgi:trigger factor